jgi:alternate signal-mediated exported protein
MKKSTKGAAAAATAGVLLLGGAGTLAFWTDTITIGGDSIESGQLELVDTTGTNGSCAGAGWTLDSAETDDTEFDPDTDAIVPGDVLTKVCTFDVTAVGNHLRATLLTTQGQTASDLSPPVTVSSAFTIGGAASTGTITEENDGDEIEATITVSFPYGTEDNTTQNKALSVEDYTITATQVHN